MEHTSVLSATQDGSSDYQWKHYGDSGRGIVFALDPSGPMMDVAPSDAVSISVRIHVSTPDCGWHSVLLNERASLRRGVFGLAANQSDPYSQMISLWIPFVSADACIKDEQFRLDKEERDTY